MEGLLRVLRIAGWLLGGYLIIFGIVRYIRVGILPAMLISLAVVIAGPLEDLLKSWVRTRTQTRPEEPAVQLVDLATSVAFLALLIWAVYRL